MRANSNISASVIFCDDVREEAGHRRTFVGACGPRLFVGEIPILIPKFCVVTTLLCYYKKFPKTFAVRVNYGGYEVEKVELTPLELRAWRETVEPNLAKEVDAFPSDDPPKVRLTIEIAISPFVIRETGRLAAHVDTDLGTIRAGSIEVVVDPNYKDSEASTVIRRKPFAIGRSSSHRSSSPRRPARKRPTAKRPSS